MYITYYILHINIYILCILLHITYYIYYNISIQDVYVQETVLYYFVGPTYQTAVTQGTQTTTSSSATSSSTSGTSSSTLGEVGMGFIWIYWDLMGFNGILE